MRLCPSFETWSQYLRLLFSSVLHTCDINHLPLTAIFDAVQSIRLYAITQLSHVNYENDNWGVTLVCADISQLHFYSHAQWLSNVFSRLLKYSELWLREDFRVAFQFAGCPVPIIPERVVTFDRTYWRLSKVVNVKREKGKHVNTKKQKDVRRGMYLRQLRALSLSRMFPVRRQNLQFPAPPDEYATRTKFTSSRRA